MWPSTTNSRLAYAEVRPSDRQGDALAFLDRALAWFRSQGIAVRAVMTDNGPAYRAHAWRRHCAARDLRHLRPASLHPPHQWQGRTLHPAPAAPLGLGLRLPVERPPHAGAQRLAAVV